MNMEQRHDVQTRIGRRKRERRADMPGGGTDIRLGQGHNLGPRRGAGCVQHKRDIACLSRAWLRGLRGRAAFQGEAACVITGHQFQHRHT